MDYKLMAARKDPDWDMLHESYAPLVLDLTLHSVRSESAHAPYRRLPEAKQKREGGRVACRLPLAAHSPEL